MTTYLLKGQLLPFKRKNLEVGRNTFWTIVILDTSIYA